MRSLCNDDLIDLVTLAGNWEVARWLATMPHSYTEADGQEWIARVQQDHATGQPRRFAIALKESDRLIGGVGLDGSTGDESEEPALGYWLGEPHWGNGYARETTAATSPASLSASHSARSYPPVASSTMHFTRNGRSRAINPAYPAASLLTEKPTPSGRTCTSKRSFETSIPTNTSCDAIILSPSCDCGRGP
jgi:hypothetical protein